MIVIISNIFSYIIFYNTILNFWMIKIPKDMNESKLIDFII
jgi:hypothetical protein